MLIDVTYIGPAAPILPDGNSIDVELLPSVGHEFAFEGPDGWVRFRVVDSYFVVRDAPNAPVLRAAGAVTLQRI